MNWVLFALIAAQLLYTTSDLMARNYMPKYGFTWAAFLTGWFAIYFIIRIFAMVGQLYVFTSVELGKTVAMFGALGIVLANVLGLLVFKEILPPWAYIGVSLAIIAFFVLAFA
ncbi:MAG: hypothetical protein ABIE94_05800 [archaeon]